MDIKGKIQDLTARIDQETDFEKKMSLMDQRLELKREAGDGPQNQCDGDICLSCSA